MVPMATDTGLKALTVRPRYKKRLQKQQGGSSRICTRNYISITNLLLVPGEGSYIETSLSRRRGMTEAQAPPAQADNIPQPSILAPDGGNNSLAIND